MNNSNKLYENSQETNTHIHDEYDLDVSHYTIHELLLLFGLDDDSSKRDIIFLSLIHI
mgnify:CR=1 FL=1